MDYEHKLRDKNIPLNVIINETKIPSLLYKYQSFYSSSGCENKYWRENIKGAFHLSLASEFEDDDDCKPSISKDTIFKNTVASDAKRSIEQDEYINSVQNNYQNNIRIGCFTTSHDNNDMWEKYGDHSKGFCIEYDTSKNYLFEYSTLPVCYSETPFDIAESILQMVQISYYAQKRHLPDNIAAFLFSNSYEKIIKQSTVPIFIKKTYWKFEDEYRMFILKHRKTDIGELEADKILDSQFNIDLSNAITGIYLGNNFKSNNNYEKILKEMLTIIPEEKIHLKSIK